jgi:hypothetical protein
MRTQMSNSKTFIIWIMLWAVDCLKCVFCYSETADRDQYFAELYKTRAVYPALQLLRFSDTR